MSPKKSIESVILEAQERGDFDNLKGKGKPIDLSAYFETPEEFRLTYSVLKNANMVAAEVELLGEIAALKEKLPSVREAAEREKIQKALREKQLQFNVMMEKRTARRGKK